MRGIVSRAVLKIRFEMSLANSSADAGFIIFEGGKLCLKSNKFSGLNFHFCWQIIFDFAGEIWISICTGRWSLPTS